MRKAGLAIAVACASVALYSQSAAPDLARWEQQAKNVTIVRDDWGIAHVHGKSDADAVFGMIYAQAEDDFNRVETNFINGMGRLAEAEGDQRIWQDLRMKIFIDPVEMKKQYDASPAWLKPLMNAWADGLNFYLARHPQVKPRVITKFEPWMALTFTEGSIGGDIEKVNLGQLQAFYGPQSGSGSSELSSTSSSERALSKGSDPPFGDQGQTPLNQEYLLRGSEPGGSNGAAVAAANTTAHHALLLINPHTSFFFRSELQMTSDEGLNAYGASTWGQMFVYQGWNEHTGWMHTSSAVDAVDEYLETVTKKGDHYVYTYGAEERPVKERTIAVPYKSKDGVATKTFTVFYTQHGPIVRENNGKWVAEALMQEPVKALMQSFGRTKSKNYTEFKQTMDLHTNSSNNTIYADSDGNIAYFHGNYIPKRDPKFDWTRPVDGSDPATDYHGLLTVDETPHLFNPASGWLYNSNNSPWSAAGPSSPKKADFPVYVDSGSESARGLHAIRVLQNKKDFTLDGLQAAAYDSYQTWFEKPIPALIKAWDDAPASNPNKAKLAEQIAMLRTWDLRWSPTSVPTSLAYYWQQDVSRAGGRGGGGRGAGAPAAGAARGATSTRSGQAAPAGTGRASTADDPLGDRVSGDQMLDALASASDRLAANFGTWKTPWGDINRFQRLTDDIVHPFDDTKPSIPVNFTTATQGSLASFATRTCQGCKKIYGVSGNSFVAVVEFGSTIHAKAVTAGGESGDPKSPHFNDQAQRYATGNLREVYFYPAQLKGHTEREYHPGQ